MPSLRYWGYGHRSQWVLMSEAVKEYTIQNYLAGWSLTRAAEAILAITDRYHWLRPHLAGAWRAVSTWRSGMGVDGRDKTCTDVDGRDRCGRTGWTWTNETDVDE